VDDEIQTIARESDGCMVVELQKNVRELSMRRVVVVHFAGLFASWTENRS
jgi:hypothetical protein